MNNTKKSLVVVLLSSGLIVLFCGGLRTLLEQNFQLEKKDLIIAQKDKKLALYDSLLTVTTEQTGRAVAMTKGAYSEHLACEQEQAIAYKQFEQALRQSYAQSQEKLRRCYHKSLSEYRHIDSLYSGIVDDYRSLSDSNLVVWRKYVYLATIVADIKTGQLSISDIDSLNIQL